MYPHPQTNQQGTLGFSNSTQQGPGEGPGYPLMQGGGGFQCPPGSTYPPAPNAFPSYPPSQSMPSQFSSACPVNDYGASAFGRAPYPDGSSSAYPSSQNSTVPNSNFSPYNPNSGSAMPYQSDLSSAAPYPPNTGSAYSSSDSPYAPNAGSSPYNIGSVHYPSNTGPLPYSSGAPHAVPYPPSSSGPYPPPSSGPFPPPSSGPYPPSSAGPYPPSSSGPYPPSSSSSFPPSSGSLQQQSPYPPTGPQGYAPKMSESSYSSFSSSNPSSQSAGVTWPYQERATVRQAMSFDPSADAAILRKAMKGFGTDEKAIIAVLGRRTSQQRQQIKVKYQQAFGKDLIRDLKSELGGRFEYIVLALMAPLPDFLADELNNAIKGAGTKETALIEIICSSDNQTISAIKAAYTKKFQRPLEKDLRSDLSGDLQHLLIANATGCRDENNNDISVASRLAQSLYDAGVKKKFGTDESEFIRILSCYSYPVLRCVFSEYAKITGKSLDAAINSETSGYFKTGLLALYHSAINRASYFAKELHNAMKGAGTKDNTLVRIVVSRCEIDMGNIKDEYHKMFGRRLEDAISGDTSGDYKSLLLTLIQG